ncbi:MAG: hypothetical protein V7603_1190 [Micromonosporaceae bacterium]
MCTGGAQRLMTRLRADLDELAMLGATRLSDVELLDALAEVHTAVCRRRRCRRA